MAEPPKVLWISCVGEKGGAEVYLLNLLRRLDRTRFAPEVALLRPGPLEKELRDLEANVHLLRPHRMRDVPAVLGAVGQLTRLLRDGGFALVHSNAFRAHVYGGLAAWRAGVPEVWSVHTAEQPGWITRAVLSIPTSHVIANAPRTADWFVARHLPTSLIWPSIDVEQLARALPRSEVAQRLELPADARWVTVGARLQRYKGQEFFLRALAALPEKFRDVHGVVMGGALFGAEQDYPESLRRLAAELGLAERVHFTGFIGEPALLTGVLAGSELVVHPALDEDFGLVVAEAQGVGRPVLAFAATGPAAIIKDDLTGRLVPVGDQAALNRELAALLGDPALLRTWGEAARRRAANHFDARPAARQLERVYERVLELHAR